MIERVIYIPAAAQDISASHVWLENCLPGLGDEFLDCVEDCILIIRRHPEIYPVAVDEFRRAKIRRFPYEIFYRAANDALTIYSVFHCSQDPEKWQKRLGDPD